MKETKIPKSWHRGTSETMMHLFLACLTKVVNQVYWFHFHIFARSNNLRRLELYIWPPDEINYFCKGKCAPAKVSLFWDSQTMSEHTQTLFWNQNLIISVGSPVSLSGWSAVQRWRVGRVHSWRSYFWHCERLPGKTAPPSAALSSYLNNYHVYLRSMTANFSLLFKVLPFRLWKKFQWETNEWKMTPILSLIDSTE